MASNIPFRKAPLNETKTSGGWLVFRAGKNPAAWAQLPGAEGFEKAFGPAEIEALKAKAKEKSSAAGVFVREIPESWIALPTGIDIQVHLRHPGQPHKEELEGGLASALLGGYDAVLTMPNTQPFLDNAGALRAAQESARSLCEKYPVKIAFTASATLGMKGESPTDIDSLAEAGAAAITDDGWGVKSAEAQDAIFAACARNDLLFQQHAEMPGHRGVATSSAFQRSHKLPEYPRSAECDMIRRDIALLRKTPNARYHVLHVSTLESLEEIRKAKAEGLHVTAEVTPHHLFFSNSDIPPGTDERSAYFKMNPPLFGPEDKAALRAALRDGTIDCVSTDHAPHEKELKAKGWLLSPFGTRGLETALPALLTLVKEGELTLERLEEVFSTVPRRILNQPALMEPSGMLFVNPHAAYTVTEKELPGVSVNSCFLGATLHGRIELRCEPGAVYERRD